MRANFFADPGEWLQRTEPFLLRREAENNLALGVASRLCRKPAEMALCCDVEETTGAVLAVGVQAKEWNMIVTQSPDDVIERMALEISAKPQATGMPGVSGPSDAAGAFARQWAKITGKPAMQKGHLRIYQADQIATPQNVSGAMVPAAREDLDRIVAWMIDFSHALDDPRPVERADIEERFHAGHFFLWRDLGQTVSMAAWAGPTPKGIRINSVYTPPEFRNHGYASANVAALSQHLLDSGRKFVFLFTDLLNPTSNSIYQKIGYRPVCDFADYRFG
jgi:predicted GNAT family acetyltransferase